MVAASKNETEKAAAEDSAAAPARKAAGLAAFLPLLATLLLAPLGTWAAVEFVIVPRLEAKLAHGAPEPAPSASAAAGKGAGAKVAPEATYEFQNVVVNLAGTMGTRYLKTSLVVTGADPGLKAAFEAVKPQMTDVTLSVLSSLTLGDLDQPGSKNVIREKLVAAYNQVLGRKVADQVYFSDFVIQ